MDWQSIEKIEEEHKTKIKKYRKKPIIIKAIQYDGTQQSFEKIKKFTNGKLKDFGYDYHGIGEVFIDTLEGETKVNTWDLVIRGVKGEFYPCKPDIFKLTYEEVI